MTEKWISTRLVTLPIKALCQTWTCQCAVEEDAQILATLLKHIPSCTSAADIDQLLQDIPDRHQPPVVVPARTVREAIEAGDLPPLDRDAANVFSESERILQEHVLKH